MSEAGIDGFPGNPVRVIGKSLEVENVQIAPWVFYWLIFVKYTAYTWMLVDLRIRVRLKSHLQYPGDYNLISLFL